MKDLKQIDEHLRQGNYHKAEEKVVLWDKELSQYENNGHVPVAELSELRKRLHRREEIIYMNTQIQID
ncbi:MAG: hypothetical protein Kow0042_20950 [Calditrichia bacterium]